MEFSVLRMKNHDKTREAKSTFSVRMGICYFLFNNWKMQCTCFWEGFERQLAFENTSGVPGPPWSLSCLQEPFLQKATNLAIFLLGKVVNNNVNEAVIFPIIKKNQKKKVSLVSIILLSFFPFPFQTLGICTVCCWRTFSWFSLQQRWVALFIL